MTPQERAELIYKNAEEFEEAMYPDLYASLDKELFIAVLVRHFEEVEADAAFSTRAARATH